MASHLTWGWCLHAFLPKAFCWAGKLPSAHGQSCLMVLRITGGQLPAKGDGVGASALHPTCSVPTGQSWVVSTSPLESHSGVQFSCSVGLTLCNPMDRTTPGLPVHHQIPEFTQAYVHRVVDAIQPSYPVVPFSSRLQSFPASGSFQMSQFFASVAQSIGVSASASVLPMNIQDWFPLYVEIITGHFLTDVS